MVIITTIIVTVAFNATITLLKPSEVIYSIEVTIYNSGTATIPALNKTIKAFPSL